jgi:hypothetical protein
MQPTEPTEACGDSLVMQHQIDPNTVPHYAMPACCPCCAFCLWSSATGTKVRLTYEPHWPRTLPYTALRPSAVEMRTGWIAQNGALPGADFPSPSEQTGCHHPKPNCLRVGLEGLLEGQRECLRYSSSSPPPLSSLPFRAVAGDINPSGCTRRPHHGTVL